jgi:hypothetical protein
MRVGVAVVALMILVVGGCASAPVKRADSLSQRAPAAESLSQRAPAAESLSQRAPAAESLSQRTDTQPLIVLLTDFGERDHYVGAMKGAIYSVNPNARIDSITHQIEKYNITEGAYTLAEAAKEYPNGTIFVGIVDPGVGSERNDIAIRARNGKFFVGPDNGLLSIAADEAGIIETRELTNKSLMHSGEMSSTFHGRDVFGPVAGHLAAGAPFASVGPPVRDIVKLSLPQISHDGRSSVGVVLHVDDYGNLITNIPAQSLEKLGLALGSSARVSVGQKNVIARFVRTYSDVPEGEFLFLNNRGNIEIAINRGNLGEAIGTEAGMEVVIRPR